MSSMELSCHEENIREKRRKGWMLDELNNEESQRWEITREIQTNSFQNKTCWRNCQEILMFADVFFLKRLVSIDSVERFQQELTLGCRESSLV